MRETLQREERGGEADEPEILGADCDRDKDGDEDEAEGELELVQVEGPAGGSEGTITVRGAQQSVKPERVLE